ncbi:MAG: methylated-DNA--[protein]-cysteine S-methyltransferase [Candidatus Bathyarchaeia archaeon]
MIGLYTKKSGGTWFGVACDEQHVFATSFTATEQKAVRDLLTCLPFNAEFQVSSAATGLAEKALRVVEDIYDGKGQTQNVPLAMEWLPAYTQRVLQTVALIPVGYVSSYGRVAAAAGGGARAVGNVMASNPFAPIVPCHRVVGWNLGLGGYGGGLDRKQAFLVREKRSYKEPRDIPVGEKKLTVFPVENVLNRLKTKK